MDDGVGREPIDRAQQPVAVERISDHRPGAEAGEPVGARVAADEAENLVVVGDELAGNRHADRAARAGEQNLHDFLPADTRR